MNIKSHAIKYITKFEFKNTRRKFKNVLVHTYVRITHITIDFFLRIIHTCYYSIYMQKGISHKIKIKIIIFILFLKSTCRILIHAYSTHLDS